MKRSPASPRLAIRLAVSLAVLLAVAPSPAHAQPPRNLPLPTGKQLHLPQPGAPQSLNSLPMAAAWSPDHRYLALVNAGFGTLESGYDQSIAILDTATGKVSDFPQPLTALGAAQTLYSGIAFSTDGTRLYVTVDSLTAPTGGQPDRVGNGILVYRFRSGSPQLDHVIPIGLQPLPPGAHQNQFGAPIPAGKAIPAPAGIAVVPARDGQPERILVADNFSDDVLLIDPATATTLHRFDLSAPPSAPGAAITVPSTYPVAVVADGRFAYVALWNASAVARLDLLHRTVAQTLPLLPPANPVEPGSHPSALLLSPDRRRLYVALANRDAVAVVRLAPHAMRLVATLDTRLPGQHFFGAMPDALALSADGTRLYAADTGSNAVAVLNAHPDTQSDTHPAKLTPTSAPLGFIPTDWYPTALAIRDNQLFIATGKGQGTGPNAIPPQIPASVTGPGINRLRHRAAVKGTYIATLLHGSLASVDLREASAHLAAFTREAVADNRMTTSPSALHFASAANPIRHVIYIIRENRTYDQDLGDLSFNGQPVGNGDPALTLYGASITPNLHKLALQFGVLDNFYDSGEVSGDGHVWSTAGITSDYTEKTWQQSYRGRERPYDYEGVVEQGYPLLENISDIDEPDSGYLWTDLARHHVSLYHFGEFISTKFCDDSGEAPKDPSPLNGTPEPRPEHCDHPAILPGAAIPAIYGGGRSPYPWKIPLIFRNVATKPELVGHFDPDYADFNLSFPDQLRFEEFARHFRQWVATRESTGADPMPAFVMLRFPNDHTAGTTPGMPTPRASVADNDLALGRTVEAISHSPYWNDTAIFVLEDDAQDGADHVDAHRSLALVISKYSPRRPQPVVDSHFYTTVSVLRTIEELLGIPPMNNNDAWAPAIAPLFTGSGNQPAYTADTGNRDNGLIYTANTRRSYGAAASSQMDFTHEDRADPRKLNVILWRDARGNAPLPPQLKAAPASAAKGDDD